MWTRRLFVLVLALWASSAAADQRTISVTGHAAIASRPDMATISMGVTTEARTAAAALSANSRDTRSVLDALAAAGIAERDLQTSSLSLSPIWSQRSSAGKATITGFRADNQIRARVRDLAGLGAILDKVVGDGANYFNGLTFGLQEPQPVADAALQAAVADGLRQARLIADAAGVELGPILEISANAAPSARPMMAVREMAMSEPVPIAEGEITTNATATLTVAIAD